MKNDPLKIFGMHERASPKVFQNAAKLRDHMTVSEKKLWGYLGTKPMRFKFRRQHSLAGYVLDFYCHKLRLSIEIDGNYHLKTEQKEKDEERTEYLKNLGITEIRFTNYQVLHKFETIIENINNRLQAGHPLGLGQARAFKNKNK